VETRLSLLPFLQEWDGGAVLSLRLLAVPRGSPLDPLVPSSTSGPSFATANLTFDLRLVPGLETMATTGSSAASVTIAAPAPPLARALLQELESQLRINSSPPAPNPRPVGVEIRKYAPLTYRTAAGFSGSRTLHVVDDDSYQCAVRSPPTGSFRKLPDPSAFGMPWGKVLALALRQPALAEVLGLIRPLTLTLPSGDLFQNGGWVYVTLAPASDAFELAGEPDALKLYATRVPPLRQQRRLFTAVLFPVATTVPPGPYDDLFQEAADYDDGFAKIVHGRQPTRVDALNDEDVGERPPKDIGIRLAWDDEQTTIWLNRQVDIAAAPLDSPMGVHGYRVDVRAGGNGPWSSLCQAQGPVAVGSIVVGDFRGELDIQTLPTQLDGQKVGAYWLPMYYTQWSGGSLLGTDRLALRLAGVPPDSDRSVIGVPPPVSLRYGQTYQFRIRLADHTNGGPSVEDESEADAPQPVTTIPFRRHIRPGAPRLAAQAPPVAAPSAPITQLTVLRPRLGHPAYIYTGTPNAEDELLADLPAAQAEGREPGLPDPDVTATLVSVQVQALGFDDQPGGGTAEGYHPVYETTRAFPSDTASPVVLNFQWVDVAQVDGLMSPSSGAILLPTARNVRLVLTSLAREDPGKDYFGAEDVRFGGSVSINLRADASDERGLFRPDLPANHLRAVFQQPDGQMDAAVALAQRAAGRGVLAPQNAVGRLAQALDLDHSELTLRARPGRRIVLGMSAAIRHALAPDASSVTVASKADLTQHWIVALRVSLARDWTWDGLSPLGVRVLRQGQEVGRIEPRRAVNHDALLDPQRGETDLVFLDAVDPKPGVGGFPAELLLQYRLEPTLIGALTQIDPPLELTVRLPVTVAPAQVLRLASAGIALSSYERSADYSSTNARQRALWLEFDRPVEDPGDAYFARVLAYAPDPLLAKDGAGLPEAAEPPLPIDPEPIRVVVPGQSDDRAGEGAMQRLIASNSPFHFMLPLPPGHAPAAPELFGFFTYELRVGHADVWSTAQARFGPPLRVTGVQHPVPQLLCAVIRNEQGIFASAPFANPVSDGRSIRPVPPRTQMWILLYVQVTQSDGADRRNVLLDRKQASQREPPVLQVVELDYGSANWSNAEVNQLLDVLLLPHDEPLSCLAVEIAPGAQPFTDPLRANLGYERILRTSPLISIPPVC
jgi:hypothetical protein